MKILEINVVPDLGGGEGKWKILIMIIFHKKFHFQKRGDIFQWNNFLNEKCCSALSGRDAAWFWSPLYWFYTGVTLLTSVELFPIYTPGKIRIRHIYRSMGSRRGLQYRLQGMTHVVQGLQIILCLFHKLWAYIKSNFHAVMYSLYCTV